MGFVVMLVVGVGGFMAIDFNMSKRWASKEDAEGLTFAEYLGGFSERIASVTGSTGSSGLPTALADMMPKAPEGWTVRPTVAEDVAGFMPKKRSGGSREAREAVEKIASAKGGGGTEVVVLTYEKGERRVVIKAVRYPNVIFTSFMAMQQRFELQMQSAEFTGTQFMTVRGLDVTEDLLPDGMRARLFLADVGAQIHLRVLASERMKDADMVPFFQTLNVKAMNASVVDKQEGLGDVPVIVLASVLDEATRAAYEADLAAREAEAAARSAEERKLAEAEAAAAEAEAAKDATGEQDQVEMEGKQGLGSDCEKGVGGTKRCKVGGG